MTSNHEAVHGVGEDPEREIARTDLLDFVASEGLKKIVILTSALRRLNQEHPHHTDIPKYTFFLEQLNAFLEMGLKEAGYPEEEIHRVQKSIVQLKRAD